MIRILMMISFGLYLQAASLNLPENFQADFTQKVTNTKKKTLNYAGKVSFSNNSLLKWTYVKPTKKEVCTDGKELVVVDHDLEQISNYRIDKGFNFTKIVKNAKLHSKNVYVAKYENKSYTIQVDGKNRLHSIAYFDDLENKVQIVFKKVNYGKGNLPKKKMQCKRPKAYDVIRG